MTRSSRSGPRPPDVRRARSPLRCTRTTAPDQGRRIRAPGTERRAGGGDRDAAFAAGWCGKAFADLGADVVKVEPPDGDALRADRGPVRPPEHEQAQRGRRGLARRGAVARGVARRRRPRDRDAGDAEPRRLGHRRATTCSSAIRRVCRARHHRLRRDRALRRLRVERPGRAGVQRRGGHAPGTVR